MRPMRDPEARALPGTSLLRQDVQVWAVRSGARPTVLYGLRNLSLRPGFVFVLLVRLMTKARAVPCAGPMLGRAISRLIRFLFASCVAPGVRIGGGLYVPHPFGIQLGKDTTIGANATILQNATVGTEGHGTVRIGRRVYLGAGCRVAAGVRIEDSATIGANAHVVTDIPSGSIAVGSPVRIARSR